MCTIIFNSDMRALSPSILPWDRIIFTATVVMGCAPSIPIASALTTRPKAPAPSCFPALQRGSYWDNRTTRKVYRNTEFEFISGKLPFSIVRQKLSLLVHWQVRIDALRIAFIEHVQLVCVEELFSFLQNCDWQLNKITC